MEMSVVSAAGEKKHSGPSIGGAWGLDRERRQTHMYISDHTQHVELGQIRESEVKVK